MLSRMLDRPVAVTMILLTAIVLGAVALRQLPVSLMPDIDVPTITVRTDEASLSSLEIEETLLKPLRLRLMQVQGLEEITTQAKDGGGTVIMQFSQGTDMDYAFIEVNEKIDRTMPYFTDISRPKVMKTGASDIPAFYLNLTLKEDRDERFTELSKFAEDVIVKRVEQLDEVAMVDVSGTVDEEILVIPDVQALQRLGLSLSDFEMIIKSANVQLGSLTIHDGEYRYSVRFLSYAKSDKDIADIYFKSGNKLLQVKDIASVITHPAKRSGLVRSDGKTAVCMAVIKQSSAKMSDLRKDLNALMAHFSAEYPGITFTLTRDQTQLLDYSITSLLKNIIIAILLSIAIIFIFLKGWKPSLLVGLTIPVSLIISMLAFRAFGIGINIISLSGLILGVGMMVDNSIILVDNIAGHIKKGEAKRDAVIKGTEEVQGAMLSSVMTTCAVFLPLIFLSGTAGALFKDEALSITIVLLVSWLVTVSVIPVMHYHLPDGKDKKEKQILAEEKIVRWSLKHCWISWILIACCTAGSVFLFNSSRKEKLPPMSYTETILDTDWNEPLTLEENEQRTAKLEELVTDASQSTSMVGSQKFLLSHSGDLGVTESSVYMNFNSVKEMEKAKEALSEHLKRNYPKAAFDFRASGNIFDMVFADTQAPLVVRLRPLLSESIDPQKIKALLESLAKALPDCAIPSVPVKTDVVFVADPQIMALYNISYSNLASVLKNSLNQNTAFQMVQGNRSVPVVIGTDRENLETILDGTTVRNAEGIEVPVAPLMRQTFRESFKTLTAGVEGQYYPLELDIKSSDVESAIKAIRETVRADGNFEAGFSGSYYSNRELIREMAWVFLIAVIMLFLILASQFESVVQPLIILSEIIVDIFFCLLFIKAAGLSINLMTMIGMVVICGIVINDSILKIDTINRNRKEGEKLEAAIIDASGKRFKAIVMTSLTTILSVLPFLSRGSMGSDLQFPMSIVIIIGMVVGTLVSLFVVPALYYSIHRER